MVRLNVVIPGAARPQEVMEALRFIMAGARLEEGCLACSAWADQEATVHYTEEWASEPDMRRRVRSISFTSLLVLVESAQAQPTVQFDFVAATRGVDYVAEVRGIGIE
jgi:quinol monooxygenase YgiN